MTADPVSFRDRYTRSEWIRLWIVLAVIAGALVAGINALVARSAAQDHQKQCDRMAPMLDMSNQVERDWWEANCHI